MLDGVPVGGATQGDEDLLSELWQRLLGQLFLQVVFGREVPQDA